MCARAVLIAGNESGFNGRALSVAHCVRMFIYKASRERVACTFYISLIFQLEDARELMFK